MASSAAIRSHDMPPLSMRAEFVPSTIDVEARTVQLTWTTGARVLRGYYDPYWEELSLAPSAVRMDRLRSGAAPLLSNHGQYDLADVIGVVVSAQLDRASGTATVRFDAGPVGDDVFRKVRDGILRNVSVGYRVYKMQKVEGGEATTPVYRAVDWEPYEISIVPIGADAGAMIRGASIGTNPCQFFEERTMDPTPATGAAGATPAAPAAAPSAPAPATGAAGATPAAPAAAPSAPAPATVDAARVLQAERERVAQIGRAARALGRPQAEADAAVADGTPADVYRARAIDARAASDTIPFDARDPRITAGADQIDKRNTAAAAWLIQRAGMTDLVRAADTKRGTKTELDPGEFRGMRLLDMSRRFLDDAKHNTRGMMPMELAAASFNMTRGSGPATTSDFPIALEIALTKILLGQYAVTPDTWRRVCTTKPVPDFRPSNMYRVGSMASLDDLNELGEFKFKSIPDVERQQISTATKGNIIGISRQAIVNDDMGVFSSLAVMLGRAAALTPEVAFYTELAKNGGLGPTMADGNTLYHANHKNIGTGAAISIASIDADRVLMKSQTDPSGNEMLDLNPAVLLVPTALGAAARQINTSTYDFGSANKLQIPNPVANLFRDIVDTARLTGTRRYQFVDPGVAPAFAAVFLDGQQEPVMESRMGFESDGVQWRVRLDVKVQAVDWRGTTTNAGA